MGETVTTSDTRLDQFVETEKAFFRTKKDMERITRTGPTWGLTPFGPYALGPYGLTLTDVRRQEGAAEGTRAEMIALGNRYLRLASELSTEEKFFAVFGGVPARHPRSELKKWYGIVLNDKEIEWVRFAEALFTEPREIVPSEHNVGIATKTFEGRMVRYVSGLVSEALAKVKERESDARTAVHA